MEFHEKISDSISGLSSEAKSYVELQLDIAKLHLSEQLSRMIAGFIKNLIVAVVSLVISLFLNLALAIYLGTLLNSMALGFVVVSLVYAFLLIIVLAFRKSIIEKPVIQSVVKLFFRSPINQENEKSAN